MPPSGYVTRETTHLFPATWRPLTRHPRILAAPWASSGGMDGVVFCEACGGLWYLFFDPKEMYYTDIVPLGPEFEPVVRADGRLEDVWPLLYRGDRLVRGLVFGYFTHARYDPETAARRLVAEMDAPRLTEEQAYRLLLDLRGLLMNEHHRRALTAGHAPLVTLDAPQPLLDLTDRADLFSDPPDRAPHGRRVLRDMLDDIVRGAFAKAFGGALDMVRVPGKARARLVERAGPDNRRRLARQGLRATTTNGDLPRADEALVELETLLWATAYRPSAEDIDCLLDTFHRLGRYAAGGPTERGWHLRRRCRNLVANLHANGLIPPARQAAVAALAPPDVD